MLTSQKVCVWTSLVFFLASVQVDERETTVKLTEWSLVFVDVGQNISEQSMLSSRSLMIVELGYSYCTHLPVVAKY